MWVGGRARNTKDIRGSLTNTDVGTSIEGVVMVAIGVVMVVIGVSWRW